MKPPKAALPTYEEAKNAWLDLLGKLSDAQRRQEVVKQEVIELNQRASMAREVIRRVLAKDGILEEEDYE